MSRITVIAGVAAAVVAVFGSLAYGRADAGSEQSLQGPYLGSYTATLSAAQAAARGDARLAGRFELVLRRNGTYTMSNSLDGRSHGRLTALANRRLRFSNDTGCKAGNFEWPGGGVYRWSLNGNRLTLRLVKEGPCTGRTQTLTYPVWVRK